MKEFKNSEGFVFQFYDEEYELPSFESGIIEAFKKAFRVDMQLKDFSGKSITPKLIYNGLVREYPKANTTKLVIGTLIRKHNLHQTKIRILRYE